MNRPGITDHLQHKPRPSPVCVRSITSVVSLFIAFLSIGTTGVLAADLNPIEVMRTKGCTACHVIPGIAEARGTMGPTLKGIGTRKRIVARTLTNNEKNMRRWLKYPKAVKSDTMMPNVGLSDEEVETLISHFKTL